MATPVTFFEDRRRFFVQTSKRAPAEAAIHSATTNATAKQDMKYRFLFESNKEGNLENEFNQLFKVLEEERTYKPGVASDRRFYLFCLYCCVLLEAYYQGRHEEKKIKTYQAHKETLMAWLTPVIEPSGPQASEATKNSKLQHLGASIKKDIAGLKKGATHISTIHDWLSSANVYRILLVFSRLITKQMFMLARGLQWIDKTDDIVANVNASTPAFNALSVAIFGARLVVNIGRIAKHTFAPTGPEEELTKTARFLNELKKHYATMVNDIVWGVVNMLSNYSMYLGIAAPVATWLTAGFLFFDMIWNTYRRRLAWEVYQEKDTAYRQEIQHYQQLLSATDLSEDDDAFYKEQVKLLEKQRNELRYQWEKTNQEWKMYIAAAALIAACFSASLLLAATPAGVAVCYLICMVAIAMYLSGGAFGKWRQQALMLKEREDEEGIAPDLVLKLQKDTRDARNAFIGAMILNTIMPVLLVALYATVWPAGLALTVVYLAFCYYQHAKPKATPAAIEATPLHESEPGIPSSTQATASNDGLDHDDRDPDTVVPVGAALVRM